MHAEFVQPSEVCLVVSPCRSCVPLYMRRISTEVLPYGVLAIVLAPSSAVRLERYTIAHYQKWLNREVGISPCFQTQHLW